MLGARDTHSSKKTAFSLMEFTTWQRNQQQQKREIIPPGTSERENPDTVVGPGFMMRDEEGCVH